MHRRRIGEVQPGSLAAFGFRDQVLHPEQTVFVFGFRGEFGEVVAVVVYARLLQVVRCAAEVLPVYGIGRVVFGDDGFRQIPNDWRPPGAFEFLLCLLVDTEPAGRGRDVRVQCNDACVFVCVCVCGCGWVH